MFKFKNFEDYKNQRDEAIAKAQEALIAGEEDKYKNAVKYVEEMDAAYEAFAEEQANLTALQGAVKAPATITEKISTVVTDFMDEEMKYRHSFMNYVLKGTPIQMNSDEVTVTSDVGAVIPNTILNRIIERMEKTGQIYSKMTKTYYKGGVTVPTSATKPVATWTTERGTSEKQKKTTGSVTFTYHKLRCVVAVSVAVNNVTLDIFESTIAKNVADAMVKAIEDASFNGTGAEKNMPEGILKKTPVNGQVIQINKTASVTYKDLCAAEAALPEEYEDGTEWYMRKSTFFNEIVAMTDDNGQPIAKVNYGLSGKPEYSILGRKVNFTQYVPAYSKTPTEDTIFACMFNFADYTFNTNLQISIKEYEDHDTDDLMKKSIMLADGKPVDISSLVIMKKKSA